MGMKINRKKRSFRTSGYGRVGKHRKSPGGVANSGAKHHHKTYRSIYCPNHFGKFGMRHRCSSTKFNSEQLLNVECISHLLTHNNTSAASMMTNKGFKLGLGRAGISKILGRGTIGVKYAAICIIMS